MLDCTIDLERLSNIVGYPMYPMRPQDIERRRHREFFFVIFIPCLSRPFCLVWRENALLFICVSSASLRWKLVGTMDLERLGNIVGYPMYPMKPQDIERRRHWEILLVVFFYVFPVHFA